MIVICPVCRRVQCLRSSGVIRLHMTVVGNPEIGFCLGSGTLP